MYGMGSPTHRGLRISKIVGGGLPGYSPDPTPHHLAIIRRGVMEGMTKQIPINLPPIGGRHSRGSPQL